MILVSLDEAVAMEGGLFDDESIFTIVSKDLMADILSTIKLALGIFNARLRRFRGGGKVVIVLTRSTAPTCRTRQVKHGIDAIFVPVGMIARIQVLSRLLLHYRGIESHIHIANSILDKIPETVWDFPPTLRPLFDPRESGESFWEHLAALYSTLKPKFEDDEANIILSALIYMLSHEFGHALNRHSRFLEIAGQIEENIFRRGLELEADLEAAYHSIAIHIDLVAARNNPGDHSAYAPVFINLSYAVTMMLAVFDPHRKSWHIYEEGAYNHPLIRYELFSRWAASTISQNRPELASTWQKSELEGWRSCLEAFDTLNLDCMRGIFGQLSKGSLAYPIQAINYGFSEAFKGVVTETVEREIQLIEFMSQMVSIVNDSVESESIFSRVLRKVGLR